MAKKAKMTNIEIINKIEETVNVLILPITAIIAIWWEFDVAVYVSAIAGALNGVLECVKMFIKD